MAILEFTSEISIFASNEEILKTMLLDKGIYAFIALIILILGFIEKHFKIIRKFIIFINRKLFLHSKHKQYKNRL